MPFNIIRHDITKVNADAVVNAANNTLLGGGGVDGAIHRAAGPALLKECITLGGCKTGNAKITKGYKMSCKYIIHTVGPIWHGGNKNEEALLSSCYENSLKLAKEHNCESVAFPLISAGVYGYPKKQAFDVAVKVIKNFLVENEMDVTLVIFDKDSIKLSGISEKDLTSYIDDRYADTHYQSRSAAELSFNMADEFAEDIETKASKTAHNIQPIKKLQKIRKNRAEAGVPTINGSVPETSAMPAMASPDLKKLFDEMDLSFSEQLFKLIDESGKKDSEIYKAANISRQAFSKIRSDKHYHPKKITVLSFAVGLRLTLGETETLLKSAGYALTRSEKLDIIVGYFIDKKIYDYMEINQALFDFDLPLLGSN